MMMMMVVFIMIMTTTATTTMMMIVMMMVVLVVVVVVVLMMMMMVLVVVMVMMVMMMMVVVVVVVLMMMMMMMMMMMVVVVVVVVVVVLLMMMMVVVVVVVVVVLMMMMMMMMVVVVVVLLMMMMMMMIVGMTLMTVDYVVTNIYLLISGGRIFHTATALSSSDILIYGGRTSPAKPCAQTLLLSLTNNTESISSNSSCGASQNGRAESEYEGDKDFQSSLIPNPCYKQTLLNCGGDIPEPRWRHSATHVFLPDGMLNFSSLVAFSFCRPLVVFWK